PSSGPPASAGIPSPDTARSIDRPGLAAGGGGVAADLDVAALGRVPGELGGAAHAVAADVDDHVLDGVARLAVHLRGGLVGVAEVSDVLPRHVDVRVIDDLRRFLAAQALPHLEQIGGAQVVR